MKIATLLNLGTNHFVGSASAKRRIARLVVRFESRKLRSFRKGQTFVEVLVALGVIIVITTAISGIVINSMSNSRFSKDQNLATQYAQEGMEIVRRLRDNDYITFRTYNTTYCLDGGSDILGSNCSSANVNGFFLRKVVVTQSFCAGSAVADSANVIVTVSWQDGKCPTTNIYCHAVRLESCLSTVNPAPTL